MSMFYVSCWRGARYGAIKVYSSCFAPHSNLQTRSIETLSDKLSRALSLSTNAPSPASGGRQSL